jgi:hypothetical protein
MLLDTYLPQYFVREVNHFALQTPPAETFQAVCNFDMAGVNWIRHLFQVRTILEPHSPNSDPPGASRANGSSGWFAETKN